MISKRMEKYMRAALEEAKTAAALGEIPIGAVIVRDGEIIARGHNLTESDRDPTAHAEINAIRAAARRLGGWRLLGCEMYVTAEPCAMCAGAIVWSRLEKVTIGTMDPKAGACGSLYNIVQDPRLNHRVELETGLLGEECRELMRSFFRGLRRRNGGKQE
ncbi:MAG: tRNA adenosine(34) deaminase TadA [Anaerovoracaceae bacterium]